MTAWLKRSWWLVLAAALGTWALFVRAVLIASGYAEWKVVNVAAALVIATGLLLRTRNRMVGGAVIVLGAVPAGYGPTG